MYYVFKEKYWNLYQKINYSYKVSNSNEINKLKILFQKCNDAFYSWYKPFLRNQSHELRVQTKIWGFYQKTNYSHKLPNFNETEKLVIIFKKKVKQFIS